MLKNILYAKGGYINANLKYRKSKIVINGEYLK